MTAREILLGAAVHLEQYGWKVGALGGPGVACCARGAISAALCISGDVGDQDAADAALVKHLGLQLPELPDSTIGARRRSAIYRWNDAPERTASEVIAALRGAAEVA